MDDRRVYIPLQRVEPAETDLETLPRRPLLAALDRESGNMQWSYPVDSAFPPVVGDGVVFVTAARGAEAAQVAQSQTEIHAFDVGGGQWRWGLELDHAIRAPLILRGSLLVALVEPDELIAINTETRQIAWHRRINEPGAVLMRADDRAVYITTATGRAMAVRLTDGVLRWEQKLTGALFEPAFDDERVYIGSDANSLWALEADPGKEKWHWERKIFGGDVIGSAVADEKLIVASLDNIVRALNPGNGNQLWKKPAGTRPVLPPRAFFGVAIVTGISPTLAAFDVKTGLPLSANVLTKASLSTWSAPAEAELQGAPLIDEYLKAFRVAIVVVLRDGRVIALRPTEMMFKETAPVAITALPGRPLARESLPQ